MSRGKWTRPLCFGLTVVLLGVAAIETWVGFTQFGYADAFGDDLAIYTKATVRLFSGEGWYLERQFQPYAIEGGDVLYPPVTAFFFAPWVVLGPAAYLVVAVGIVGWSVWSWRPAPWAWPLIALCLLVPATFLKAWSGNPSLWIGVAVGLALRWGWPGALVLLKVTFLPFALIGIRHPGWWLALACLAIASIPFLGQTVIYPTILLNASNDRPFWYYSVWDWPMALIPVLAAVSRHDGDAVTARAAALRARLRPTTTTAATGPPARSTRTRG